MCGSPGTGKVVEVERLLVPEPGEKCVRVKWGRRH